MTLLSVVVAAGPAMGDPGRCASALLAEASPGDEILWVGAPAPTAMPAIVDVAVAGARDRGSLYRSGLDHASNRFVVFIDASTVVQPGWRRAVERALTTGAPVVGGPVLPGPRRRVRDVAGFVVEYGPHAVAPFVSATNDVASNNVAYDRDALEAVLGGDEPVWKNVVDSRLTAQGSPPVLDPEMCVESTKRYRWRDLFADRFAHGRQYGAQRASTTTRLRRGFLAARCIVLPAVAYGRLGARISQRRDLRRRFALASPVVLLALASWSLGEAAGLCTATGARRDIF